jgi:hypothetical protein
MSCCGNAQVKLLRHLQHENVIGLRDIMRPADCQIADFGDIYLVYELMDTDLHQIIRSGQHLSDQHLQYFIYQVGAGTARAPPGIRENPSAHLPLSATAHHDLHRQQRRQLLHSQANISGL